MRIVTWRFGSPGHKTATRNRSLFGKPFIGRTEMAGWIADHIKDKSDLIFLELTDSAGAVRTIDVFGTLVDDEDKVLFKMRWEGK